MATLKISNDYSYLLTNDDKLKETLWKSLRFYQRNHWASPLFKNKTWDGKISYFSKANGKFLTGLLPEIKGALRVLGHEYDMIDDRKMIQFPQESINNQFLNQFLPKSGFFPDGKPANPITLEDYQVHLANQSIQYQRGIVKAPTGSGKSFTLSSIVLLLPPNTPTLILSNRKGIVTLNYNELKKWGLNPGRFDGEAHEPGIITCATVQSIDHIEKLLPKFKVLIVDEVHMMMNPTAISCYRKLKNCSMRIGISATPFKYEKKNKKTEDPVHKYNVKGYFGPLFKNEIEIKELQDRGRLSKCKCTFYPIDHPQIPYDIYLDAITNGIAKSWHFHDVVSKLVKKLTGRTLILVERISHGDALHNLIPGSAWIRGEDSSETRQVVIDRLTSDKEVIAIATSGIFSVGVDFRCQNIINCASGQAEHDVTQRIGRGLRPADDKEMLNYYDFIFKINPYLEKHSLKRIKILKDEGHEVIIKTELDF